jgi:hypothetical protein
MTIIYILSVYHHHCSELTEETKQILVTYLVLLTPNLSLRDGVLHNVIIHFCLHLELLFFA